MRGLNRFVFVSIFWVRKSGETTLFDTLPGGSLRVYHENPRNHMRVRPQAETNQGWWAWLAVSSFYLFQFILRVSPVALEADFIQSFHIDAGGLGILGGLYYMGYAGMQLPLGIAFDTWGVRRVLLSAAALCLSGAMCIVVAPSFYLAALGRLLLGMGAAGGFLGSMKIASTQFRPALFATLVGLENLVGVTGALLGGGPLRLLANACGWRSALALLTLCGLLSWLALWRWAQDEPQATKGSPWESMRAALRNRAVWITAFVAAALYSPVTVLADLWGAPYLKAAFAVPASWASGAVSSIYLGYGLGCCGVGYVASRCQNLQSALRLACAAVALLLGALVFGPGSWWIALLVLAGLGLAGSTVTLAYPYVCRMVPRHAGGTVSALVNIGAMIGGSLLQPAVGSAISWSSSGARHHGAPIYEAIDYQTGFAVMLLLVLLALAASAFRRKPCKRGGAVTARSYPMQLRTISIRTDWYSVANCQSRRVR